QALRVQIRRLQSGRARDLVVLAVLLGSVLYLRRSPLAVGEWFYPLAGAGALLIVIGFLVRGKIVGLLTSAASALRAASLRLTGKAAPAALSGACERCGASERIVFERPEQLTLGGALAKAELTELSVCRSCGSLRAALRDPNLVPVGPEHGTRVDQNQSDLPSGVGLEEPEHEG
ncbi:MAG TPA: hypothetical protein VGJ84_00970, partial [Polyangiaceae bacterium]